MNYFELFGLAAAPKIDRRYLSQKYFELQKRHHPDFFSRSTDEERELALEQSALINKAFNTLRDEQLTIAYFLKEKGLLQEDEKYKLPDSFLMEMMEVNEALSELDRPTAERKIAAYEEQLHAEIMPVLEGYHARTTEEDLLKLKEYYYKKKYLQRILDRLDD